MRTNQLPQEQTYNPLWSQLFYPDFPSKCLLAAQPGHATSHWTLQKAHRDTTPMDYIQDQKLMYLESCSMETSAPFIPTYCPRVQQFPFSKLVRWLFGGLGPSPHPPSLCKSRLEQQLIFQEGLFLKLLQNRPSHQGLHSVLSGDCQGETWPSCCLKTEPFCFTWQETGCNEDSAATATRGKLILF